MERWQQIESLFQEALEHDPLERNAWLQEACQDDADLRREVASLLAKHHSATDSKPRAAAAAAKLIGGIRSLEPGQCLGPYRIECFLAAGGMGAIYRATDTRLQRQVAIKVSAAQFSERFEREARLIASLNHPNICQLYDVGPNFLVMELVDGENLAGPLPLETALNYARQIADALEAAHEKGIVHRDLKPANVKITPLGVVKVLDFGLAKAAEQPSTGADRANSPTLTMSPTRAGMILGTASYMSPEQARGSAVDKRADIWAFGCVLYEMLTGRQAFHGEATSDILAAVLKGEPDLSPIPASVQPLLRRCLVKDPRRRLRDIGEARIAIDTPEDDASPVASQSRPGILASGAAALFFAIAALLAFIHFREKLPAEELVRFQVLAPGKGDGIAYPILSPNGRMIAFLTAEPSVRHGVVWVRSLDSLDARPLPGAEDAGVHPFWSPDSRFLAFEQQGKLKKVEVSGGTPQTLCDVPGAWLGGTWSREGVIVFGSTGHGLMRVPESGGATTPLTALDPARQETLH